MLTVHTPPRLDRRVKELAQEKEELLKTSKAQAATMESVKVQIEALLKVILASRRVRTLSYQRSLIQTASEIGKKVEELVPVANSPQDTPHPS
jgi:THO complex subunit 5